MVIRATIKCVGLILKKICDNYISWGNKSNEKNIPLFITTNIGKTIKKKTNRYLIKND